MSSLRPARRQAVFRRALRRAGLDANPLRRGPDYAETAATVLLAVTFIMAGPGISVALGESVAHAENLPLGLGTGVLTQTTLGLLLWDVRRKIRHALDRRRPARWERAWELIEPRWSDQP